MILKSNFQNLPKTIVKSWYGLAHEYGLKQQLIGIYVYE